MIAGLIYATGSGVAKDEILAYAWFNLAAAKGKKEAIIQRDELEKRMTDIEKSKAQALSSELVAKLPKQ